MPDQGSFFVEVTVLKELEDLRRPQMAVGAAVFDKQNAILRIRPTSRCQASPG